MEYRQVSGFAALWAWAQTQRTGGPLWPTRDGFY